MRHAGGRSRLLCAALAKAVLHACLSETQVLGPLVLLHAALLRALSIRAGSNVLTTFVEHAVCACDTAHAQAKAANAASEHACANAALLLGHLYNFGAVHANLIYDLVRRLVDGFGEGAVLGRGGFGVVYGTRGTMRSCTASADAASTGHMRPRTCTCTR